MRIIEWHGEYRSAFYVLNKRGAVMRTFDNRPDAEAYVKRWSKS